MARKLGLLLLIGILFFISSLNMIGQGTNRVFGPDDLRVLEDHGDKSETQMQILGRSYTLSPGIMRIVQKTVSWQEQLGRFLKTVEQLVKKYGRQAQEMMRYLPERSFIFVARSQMSFPY